MSQTFEHGYAVIIGVDENRLPHLALPTVAKDVQAVHEVLTHPQRCGYAAENVQLLHGEEATQNNILEALLELQEKVQADAEATAIVYYSGHGYVDTRANQYYLIPYDFRGLNRLRIDGLKAETFTAQLADLQPKRLLVILDCCHAAGVDAKTLAPEETAAHLQPNSFPLALPETKGIPTYEAGAKSLAQLATGAGRAILNSSTGAESSYVRPDRAMSIFTYHLIEALTGHAPYAEGDNTVLVTDVMSHVTRRVAQTARQEGLQQTPLMRTSGVFPVALILGGEGVAKGLNAPDPLAPLPPAPAGTQLTVEGSGSAASGEGATAIGERGVLVGGDVGGDIITGDRNVTFKQEGQTVGGDQVNVGGDATIGQIGDSYSIGSISGGAVAIGPQARAVQEGDAYSGDFRGAILNVRSTLQDVNQNIGGLSRADDEQKADLRRLVTQLERALSQAVEREPANEEKAEAVAELTSTLVETAAAEKPNKMVLQSIGAGLKGAASTLANVAPPVLDITTKIVALVAAFSS